MTTTLGRPPIYSVETLKRTEEYIQSCEDTKDDVRLPTIEGLAFSLKIHKDTIYTWRKDEGKEPFSDLIEDLLSKQADRLVNNGLSGRYNPTIAKVLLTKHGYREGIDQTTNDRDISFVPGVIEKRANDILTPNGQAETKRGNNQSGKGRRV